MKRSVLAFLILLVSMSAVFADTTIGFGYGGLTSPTEDFKARQQSGWSAGAWFPMAETVNLALETTQAESTVLYSAGIEPHWAHVGIGFGATYLAVGDVNSLGAYIGPSLRLFQQERVGLKFSARYHILCDEVLSRDKYVDAKAMLTVTF